MSTEFEQTEYRFPSHLLSYLINGDCSGLDEDEVIELDDYLEGENLGSGHWDLADEPETGFGKCDLYYDCNWTEITWFKIVNP